jgi:solute carrier family 9 (sodium/hydrogen exchanger), member 6/7
MAQLSENFIFIYLGLTLFSETGLEYKPLFILVTVVGICVARYLAVFPLAKAINWFIRYRARRRGQEAAEELPWPHQAMLFWAGLRGAVGVALAAGLTGRNGNALKATVLVVVVLTVIIFGGTTARMLEILNIRMGVVEEIDSDDEFDIEVVTGGTYSRNFGKGLGHNPKSSTNGVALSPMDHRGKDRDREGVAAGIYSSGTVSSSPPQRPGSAIGRRNNPSRNGRTADGAEQGLLSQEIDFDDDDDDDADLDLPPPARRSPRRRLSPPHEPRDSGGSQAGVPYPTSGSRPDAPRAASDHNLTASGAISQLFSGTSEDAANWFSQIDEGFIKPKLLLDPKSGGGGGGGSHGQGPNSA